MTEEDDGVFSVVFPNVRLRCYICGETLKDNVYFYPGGVWGDWVHYQDRKKYPVGRWERPRVCGGCYEKIKRGEYST